MIRLLLAASALWLVMIAPGVPANCQVPVGMTYQGCLTDSSGMPLSDTMSVTFSVYSEPVGGLPLWSETLRADPDARGIFTVTLGLETAFPETLFGGPPLWLGLALQDREEMSPRQPLTSVPYALRSDIGEIDPSQVKGHAAVLHESQTFSGDNVFERTVNARGGSATSAAIRGDNRAGGVGLQAQTNSDLHPALLVLTGVVDIAAPGDNLGSGPLIEAWSSAFEASPPTSTFHRRLVVENDGSVKSESSFTGGRSGYAEMVTAAAGSIPPEAGDVMVIDRHSSGCVAVCESARSTRVAGICAAEAGFVSCGQTASPARSGTMQIDSTGIHLQPALARISDEQDVIPLVTAGITMCKVSDENGYIIPGDLLVTSPVSGHAMKDIEPKPGTVIGKALDSLTSSSGIIRVLVTLD